MKNHKSGLLAKFTPLVLLAVVGISSEVFSQEKRKPQVANSDKTDPPVTHKASDASEFCALIGSCRPSEIQPCSGWGTHVCVTIDSSRYFCHDCSGRGECSEKQTCGGGSWYCQKIK